MSDPAPGPHVLSVEDNAGMADLIGEYLGAHGLRVTGVRDGPAGLHAALHARPDVVLLDVMLPGLGGLEVLRRLRVESDVPVLMLTARDGEADKVLALELGADDYLTKPFSMAELLARVRALLRRAAPAPARGPLRHGPLALDPLTRDVTVRGDPARLTRVEFELLHVLLLSPRRVFTRSELLGHVQEDGGGGSERTIDVHVRNLRAKLELDPARPALIETVYGVGYRLGDG